MIFEKKEIKIKYENLSYSTQMEMYLPSTSEELAIKKRKTILILPGGGYEYTSDREAEPVAIEFCSKGYNSVVLRYSVFPVLFPISLLQVSKAILLLKENATLWNVDVDNIIVCGFSAGGHLASCIGTLWNLPLLKENLNIKSDENRPNRVILGYPVITTGEKAHKGSIENLLGKNICDTKLLELLSTEKQVSKNTPPTFIWHTFMDNAVDVSNSLMYANSLSNNGIPFELHIFQHGYHGLSLANEITALNEYNLEPTCECWVDLAIKWINR